MELGQILSTINEFLQTNTPLIHYTLYWPLHIFMAVVSRFDTTIRPQLGPISQQNQLLTVTVLWLFYTLGWARRQYDQKQTVKKKAEAEKQAVLFKEAEAKLAEEQRRKAKREAAIETIVALGVSRDMIDDAMNGRLTSKYSSSVFIKEIKALVTMIEDLTPEGRKQLQMAFSPTFQEEMAKGLAVEVKAAVTQLKIIRDMELTELELHGQEILMEQEVNVVCKAFNFLEQKAAEIGWSKEQLAMAKSNQLSITVAKWGGKLSGSKVATHDSFILPSTGDLQTLLSRPMALNALPEPQNAKNEQDVEEVLRQAQEIFRKNGRKSDGRY